MPKNIPLGARISAADWRNGSIVYQVIVDRFAPPANLDAYRVTIERGGRQVYTAEVPRHFWFARWRWQSSPRPSTRRSAV